MAKVISKPTNEILQTIKKEKERKERRRQRREEKRIERALKNKYRPKKMSYCLEDYLADTMMD